MENGQNIKFFKMDKNIIKELIKKENPVIFEIGCADGRDTQDFINTFGENLTIYCFEPEPKNIEIVTKTISHNNHHLFKGVISDTNGYLSFNRSRTDNPDDLSYSGSIKNPKEHLSEWPFIKFDESITVKSTTIDDFCELNNIEIIDFIWADVQGAEESMIVGGLKSFEKKVRFLYTEYSNKEYYEGQANLQKIVELLGTNWSVLHDFGTDVLLKNNNLQ
jgi:FkbM family methyltransferase